MCTSIQGVKTLSPQPLTLEPTATYLGVKLDRTLSYRQHLAGLGDKVMVRSALIRKLVGTGWESSPSTLRTSAQALVYTAPQHGTEASTPAY